MVGVGLFAVMIGLCPIAISSIPLAIIHEKIETGTNSSRKWIDETQTNIRNVQQRITIPKTTTSSSTNEWFLPVSIESNIFRVICSWFSVVLQGWTISSWWPSIKRTTTSNVDIEVFHDAEKRSIINVTNSILPSFPLEPPKEHLQSVVHSIMLLAGGPTSQPSRQPTRYAFLPCLFFIISYLNLFPFFLLLSQPTRQPTRQPSSQPSRRPTGQPTRQPSRLPTSQPSRQPTRQPTSQPSMQPSRQPTSQPSRQPSSRPSHEPTRQPTSQPSRQPSSQVRIHPHDTT